MMTRYQLRWDDSRTARVRHAEPRQRSKIPGVLATYAGAGHEVGRVDVYTNAEQLRGRLWRGSVESVGAAVAFCQAHELELGAAAAGEDLPDGVARPPVHPWALSTVVDGT
jgi:hypothetical protein